MRAACLAIFVVLASACHHDSPAVSLAPGEHAPLPPASGTPIGYLIDAAVDLKLTEDQLSKLRELDGALSAEIEEIDTQMRGTGGASQGSAAGAFAGGGRGRRGGMGGMGAMGGGGRHRRGGGGQGSGSGSAGGALSANMSRLTEARAADVRDALQRAMVVLDPGQQEAAKKLLDDRGVDVDAGRPTAVPATEPKAPAAAPGADDSGESGENEP
jgi:hypothetical protein